MDSRAIARLVNSQGSSRSAGTGTLIDRDVQHGWVITCAHLFRDGAGSIRVTFSSPGVHVGRLARIDAVADLAVVVIDAPAVEPVSLSQSFPRPGDPLVSCGFGSDGQLACNRGQAIGYVSVDGGKYCETLELTGSARLGDSGGPVFDRKQELVAVLFGTNGRVVDGTYCGRIRQFLAGLSPRFGKRLTPPGTMAPPSVPGAVEVEPPLAQVPPQNAAPQADSAATDRLTRLERLASGIVAHWQNLNAKVDALASAAETARQSANAQNAGSSTQPPIVELPGGLAKPGLNPIEAVAEPWLSAKLAALLISLGLPGGVAGAAAGALVWFVMRRGKQRLQAQLDRQRGTPDAAPPTNANATGEDSAVVERHHNRYVAYEVTALDKAWAAAHAHVGEKYPGAVPYLKIAEGVKDQLLSGNNEPQI